MAAVSASSARPPSTSSSRPSRRFRNHRREPLSSRWLLTLSAGLALAVEGPAPWLAALAERFPAWAGGGEGDIALRVRVQPSESPAPGASPAALPDIHLSGDALRLEGPGLSGAADLRGGEACLQPRGPDGPAQVDYALRVLAALLVERRGGLLVHGAGLVRAGRGLLLLGPSGTGKTTAARNAAGARVLNDDLVILLPEAGAGWQLHGSPFSNPSQVPPEGPAQAPLAAILRLQQAPVPRIEALSPAVALAELLAAVPVLVADPVRLPALTQRLATILAGIPMASLGLRPDPGYWTLVDPWLAAAPAAAAAQGPVT